MFKFIGRVVAGLFLTKEARQAVGQRIGQTRGAKGTETPADKVAAAQAQMRELVTPERAELIRQAMSVRAAKQTILADLDDESKARLVATAMKALLNEGRSKE